MTDTSGSKNTSLTAIEVLKLPNVNPNFPITADGKLPSAMFIALFRDALTGISSSVANAETAINNIIGILNGTIPFTGINANGQDVIHFLRNNTDGKSINKPAGLSASVVRTAAVGASQVNLPVTVNSQFGNAAASPISITNNANMRAGDFFNIGQEVWTATNNPNPDLYQFQIGGTAAETASNLADALNGTTLDNPPSVVVRAVAAGTGVSLATYSTSTGANATQAIFTPKSTSGASIGSFTGGSNTPFVINAAGTFFDIPAADFTVPVNGGVAEVIGRIRYTHNQTSQALLHVRLTRIASPTGALPYVDEFIIPILGFNGVYLNTTIFFRDDKINGAVGKCTYRYALEVTNNTGAGYAQTTDQILTDAGWKTN